MADDTTHPERLRERAETVERLTCNEIYTIENSDHDCYLSAERNNPDSPAVIDIMKYTFPDRSGSTFYNHAWKCVDLNQDSTSGRQYCELVNVATKTPLGLRWNSNMTPAGLSHSGPGQRSERWRLALEQLIFGNYSAWRISNAIGDASLEVVQQIVGDPNSAMVTISPRRHDDEQRWDLRKVSFNSDAAATIQEMLEHDFNLQHCFAMSTTLAHHTGFIATPPTIALTALKNALEAASTPDKIAEKFSKEVHRAVGAVVDPLEFRPVVGVLYRLSTDGSPPFIYFVLGTSLCLWYVTADGTWLNDPPKKKEKIAYIAMY